MLNCKQTAERLNMSVDTLRNMRRDGKLPTYSEPTPGRYVWREEDIERFAGCFPRNMTEFNRQKRIEGLDVPDYPA